MEKQIRDALSEAGILCNNVVEVDPVENDWLITSVVKDKESARAKSQTLESSHSVPAGKSIIRRLEDLADYHQRRLISAIDADKTDLYNDIDSYIRGICEALAVMKNSSVLNEFAEVSHRVGGKGLDG